MGSRSRTWRRRLLLATVVLLTALLAAEIALRVAASATGRGRGMTFDAVLGWRMLPHVEKRGASWSAREPGRTNEHGWRDRSRPLAKPAGDRRIVALGDSFTFGQGVDPHERFTDRLERDTGWQVLNFGCCAYGPDQAALVYERCAAAFEPDAVLLTVFLGNDLDDLRLERKAGWSKPWFRLRDADLELVPPRRVWTTALRLHSHLAELALQFVERHTPAARQAVEWRDADTLPLLVAVLRRLQRHVHRDGAELLVALAHPANDRGRPVRHPRADAALAELRAAGVDTIDMHGAFAADASLAVDATSATGARAAAGAPAGGAPFLPDGHWSADGHARVARELAAQLAARAWFRR